MPLWMPSPKLDLMGTFSTDNTDMDALRIRNIIYLPNLFVGIFLERELTPVEAWICLHYTIVEDGATVDFRLIIDWIWVALTRKSGEDQTSPFAMP